MDIEICIRRFPFHLESRARKTGRAPFSFRKEVIQPQVLLRLPCYDFTPIMSHTLGVCLLAVSLAASSTAHFRDVTGGVYKARERIHGAVQRGLPGRRRVEPGGLVAPLLAIPASCSRVADCNPN